MEKMMSNEFDPFEGVSAEDKAYIEGHKKAFERQQAAHAAVSNDGDREAAAEAHRRSVMAQQPGEAGPAPVPVASSVSAPVGVFSVLRAVPDTSDGELAPSGTKYAPDWKHMKEQIAAHDGTWIVSRHEFAAHVAFILGFFEKDGWDPPPDAQKESFEVIVKNSRVFRTDPE